MIGLYLVTLMTFDLHLLDFRVSVHCTLKLHDHFNFIHTHSFIPHKQGTMIGLYLVTLMTCDLHTLDFMVIGHSTSKVHDHFNL